MSLNLTHVLIDEYVMNMRVINSKDKREKKLDYLWNITWTSLALVRSTARSLWILGSG